jgi:hypothetical protein
MNVSPVERTTGSGWRAGKHYPTNRTNTAGGGSTLGDAPVRGGGVGELGEHGRYFVTVIATVHARVLVRYL